MASNTTFTSILANAKYTSVTVPPQIDFVIDAVSKSGPLTWLLTILAVAVAYDQSKCLY
jgi:sterol 22-desaturase